MGLFSKEACVFCNTEVGMLKRSKLKTKEYICNDCKRKTNYFARMDYTSKDAAHGMMDVLAQEEADFEASFDSAENRFQSAERGFKTWDFGSLRVHYRCNTRLGAFQINLNDMSRYEHIPVFYFDSLIPYKFEAENAVLADSRRNEVTNMSVNYVTVEESKDAEDKVTSCTVVIPYNNDCIREIKLKGDVRNKEEVEVFYDFAQRINQDRINWLNNGLYDEARKNKMQVRNLGDTAAAVLKAAATGGSVEEAVKQGIETDKSDASSVKVYYGWGSGDEEKYTSEIFCPEGAVFDEKTVQIYKEDGSVMTVQIDDEVNEYMATSAMHWHRDAYNSEPTVYPIIAQLYFDGELDAETAEENSNCSQEVTPLGFKWNGYDVILIETKYTFKDYGEQTELFAGVEYDLDYWKADEGTGEVLTLTYDVDDEEEFTISVDGDLLTMVDKFGNELLLDKEAVQSEEPEETEESEGPEEAEPENPYVKEIVATWVDEESGYQETFTFNADGTGMYSCVDGEYYEYPITYNFLRSDYLQFFYEDGTEGGFIIRIEGDTLYVTNDYVVDMPLVRQ